VHQALIESYLGAELIGHISRDGTAIEARERLELLGEQLDGGKKRVRSRRTDDRPVAGTKLIREWQGTPYEVIVQPDHFEFQGRRYESLSHIARQITGTIWNGWAFFGLRSARSYA
jgi:hypothetical protein